MDTQVLYLILGLFVLFIIFLYNKTISLRNEVKNSFLQENIELKRKMDLIPVLESITEKYLSHEKSTFVEVVEARNQLKDLLEKKPREKMTEEENIKINSLDKIISSSFKNMFALVESHPELKSNEAAARLMEDITSSENRISFSRQNIAESIVEYNTHIQSFPNLILAKLFNFTAFDYKINE